MVADQPTLSHFRPGRGGRKKLGFFFCKRGRRALVTSLTHTHMHYISHTDTHKNRDSAQKKKKKGGGLTVREREGPVASHNKQEGKEGIFSFTTNFIFSFQLLFCRYKKIMINKGILLKKFLVLL